jgi:hypothetical protein
VSIRLAVFRGVAGRAVLHSASGPPGLVASAAEKPLSWPGMPGLSWFSTGREALFCCFGSL